MKEMYQVSVLHKEPVSKEETIFVDIFSILVNGQEQANNEGVKAALKKDPEVNLANLKILTRPFC